MERIEWDGKAIDFTSGGIFAAILGTKRPRLLNALANADMTCCYSAHYKHPTVERYVDMLREFTGFESVALFSTGAEATEAFWRLLRTYTGKPGIWGGLCDPDTVGSDTGAHCDAMHGMTLGALVMAGKMSYPPIGVFPELGESRFGLAPEMTCGMIMEPYHAASGQFHRIDPTINHVLNNRKTHDIALCVDEVQGGFGRTGKLWAHEHYDGLKPDFVCAGKGMGGGFPLSALLGPKDIMEDPKMVEEAHLHSTHSGHPAMAAVGMAVIEEIERLNLINETKRKGEMLDHLLAGTGVRYHCKGLLAGLEFADADQANAVVRAARSRGLLTVPTGRKWVKLGPPLTISETDICRGVGLLRAAIEEVISEWKVQQNDDTEAHGDTGTEPGDGGTDVDSPWV